MEQAEQEPEAASNGPAGASEPSPRLLSVDALRGFTMFWLIGGREFVLAVAGCWWPEYHDILETQMTHPRWKGFVAWDMVMPVFLFVVGVSMPMAFAKRIGPGRPLGPTYLRIARRVAVLWLCGVLLHQIKYAPVVPELFSNALQAIAVGYLVASLALLHLRLTGQIVLFAALTVGYWALLTFVPYAGNSGGTLEKYNNFALHVDRLVLDVFRRNHSFTWVVTSMGFSASVLLGALAGHLMRARLTTGRRLCCLSAIGAACVGAGWLWSYSLPLNRYLWTSSLILWTGGWSFLMLAAFHAAIDVAGLRRWAFPFIVIGSNALLAYMLDPFLLLTQHYLDPHIQSHWPEITGPILELIDSTYEIAILWTLLWWLYRRRWFFRA